MAAPDYVYDLLASESLARWNASGPVGTPVTITFRFPTTQPTGFGYSNFTPFTAVEIAATRKALAYISSLTKITFVETTTDGAQLQFANGDLTPYGAGVGGRATYSYNTSSGITQALVALSNTGQASLSGSDFVPGSITANDIGGQGWQILLHEIGHALGLKHPFETNFAGDPNSLMPSSQDHIVNTLMSYTVFRPSNVAIVTGNENGYSYSAASLKPQTYGLFDIAALQYLYGAQETPGNKVYAFGPTSPIFETIYDRGPNSTIDLSAFSQACTIDMNPGAINALPIKQAQPFEISLQDAYNGTAALVIAYGSLIGRCIGGSGNDRITGNAGANLLDGGAGGDALSGLAGNDTYVVDTAADQVAEAKGGGTDTVGTLVSYALAAGQEIETLRLGAATGSRALNLTGNEFAQALIGNRGNNILDGGAGADVMTGAGGNDIYVVDNAADRVVEAQSGGNDTVGTLVSYALAAGQEIETLRLGAATGRQSLNLTGNEIAQALVGNGGHNVLDGKGGADVLTGAGGNDTYVVDNAADRVVEARGGGTDTVGTLVSYALAAGQEIETLRLGAATGSRALNLTGNEFAQALIGNRGDNILDGRAGADVLTGLGGADSFLFSTVLGTTNVDRIVDFAAEDTVRLSKSIFAALALGQLAGTAFKNLDAGAADATDRILYKQSTGELFYDADGSGSKAAVNFAVLDNKAALTHADFLVV